MDSHAQSFPSRQVIRRIPETCDVSTSLLIIPALACRSLGFGTSQKAQSSQIVLLLSTLHSSGGIRTGTELVTTGCRVSRSILIQQGHTLIEKTVQRAVTCTNIKYLTMDQKTMENHGCIERHQRQDVGGNRPSGIQEGRLRKKTKSSLSDTLILNFLKLSIAQLERSKSRLPCLESACPTRMAVSSWYGP